MTAVCEHGGLRRQCLICELTEERDQLRAELAVPCVTGLDHDFRPTRAYLRDGTMVRVMRYGEKAWLAVGSKEMIGDD